MLSDNEITKVRGRFAPSPSGRMHLGNVFAALMSWLSAKSQGGDWLLRIEDLDRQRCKLEYAQQIEDDLLWLGLPWDEGGIYPSTANSSSLHPSPLIDPSPLPCHEANAASYLQSQRDDIYETYFQRLLQQGMLYRCHCRRADILAQQAPHQSDGRIVYPGTCRPAAAPPFPVDADGQGAWRLYVPDADIEVVDRVYGIHNVNLTRHCGDFVVRRADGGWAYQLAVVIDDALMGVTEVVRGCDLLLSAAQQNYIYDLFGWKRPAYAHFPLLCNTAGQRLSKRDQSLSLAELRQRYTPTQIIGTVAHAAGIIPNPQSCTPADLIPLFSWSRIPPAASLLSPSLR